MDNVSLLDLTADLFVFTVTGARSALGRVPRACVRELQSVELLEAVTDLSIGKTMIVSRECCLCDNVHPELPLIGAVGV